MFVGAHPAKWKMGERFRKSQRTEEFLFFFICPHSSKSFAAQSGGPYDRKTLPWFIFIFSRQHTGD